MVLASVVLAGCATGRGSTDEPHPPDVAAWANKTDVTVFDGKAMKTFPSRVSEIGQIAVSDDGKWVAWATPPFISEARSAHLVEVETGKEREMSLTPEAGGLGFIDNVLYVMVGRTSVARVPADGQVTTAAVDGLPLARNGAAYDTTQVIGASFDELLVAVADPTGTSPQGGPEYVYAVSPRGGRARLLFLNAGNYQLGAVAVAAHQVAFAVGGHSGFCAIEWGFAVHDLATNSTHAGRLPELAPTKAWSGVAPRFLADGTLEVSAAQTGYHLDIEDCDKDPAVGQAGDSVTFRIDDRYVAQASAPAPTARSIDFVGGEAIVSLQGREVTRAPFAGQYPTPVAWAEHRARYDRKDPKPSLSSVGLGIVTLGDPEDAVVATMTKAFGDPVYIGDVAPTWCGDTDPTRSSESRLIVWKDLALTFRKGSDLQGESDSATRALWAYQVGGLAQDHAASRPARQGPASGLSSVDGVALGMPAADVLTRHQAMYQDYDESIITLPFGPVAALDRPDRSTGRVSALRAGGSCPT